MSDHAGKYKIMAEHVVCLPTFEGGEGEVLRAMGHVRSTDIQVCIFGKCGLCYYLMQ